jgi:hypothetical protein
MKPATGIHRDEDMTTAIINGLNPLLLHGHTNSLLI